jgi:hypothetical protein
MATAVPFLHAVLGGKNGSHKIALWADPAAAFPKAEENSGLAGKAGMMRLEESSGIDSAADQADSLIRSGFDPARASVLLFCGTEENRIHSEALLHRGFGSERIFLWTETKMVCAVGQCRHCTIGHLTVCREGPLLPMAGFGNLRG